MLHCMSSLTAHLFSPAKPLRPHHHLVSPIQLTTSSRLPISLRVRCRSVNRGATETEAKDYYQLLGVSVASSPKEIKDAYRRLQKKYHPDIAGQDGHEYTLLLNEAYHALMREDQRRRYDISSGNKREGFVGNNFAGSGYSSWNGPITPQALFVDENRCIGCRECVHHASKTFVMDEAHGTARVRVQFGDNEKQIEVSIESCPTNCIHWVKSEDLPVLEFLILPQPKEGHGIFGGGWERPRNVFDAAKSFNKQLKRQQQRETSPNGMKATQEEETPAQAKARYNASVKLRVERIVETFSWLKDFFSPETH